MPRENYECFRLEYSELQTLREELKAHPVYGSIYRESEDRALRWCGECQNERAKNAKLENELYMLKRDLGLLESRKLAPTTI